jgi:hypothetical protein
MLRGELAARLEAQARACFGERLSRLEVRFRGPFCYLDLYEEPEPPGGSSLPPGFPTEAAYQEHLRTTPLHLCRLRHFDRDRWSFAFYSYASERYEPSCFATGEFVGTAEEALELSASVHLG